MRIEIKALITALGVVVVVFGAIFGLSAIMVDRSHSASFQPMSESMKGDKQKMTTSMRTDKQRMTAFMNVDRQSVGAQAQLVQGHQYFSLNCASCHGSKGQGGIGPSLSNSNLSDAKIAMTIKNGVKGRMPAFGSQFKDPQVQALTAYIRSLKK